MSLARLFVYRPDLQERSLEYLKRIHDLNMQVTITHASITGNTTVRGYIAPPSDKSNASWEARKQDGSHAVDTETSVSFAKLNELKSMFDKGIVKPSEIIAANKN